MKKLLVVIDYQNDFVNGSLGFQEAVALEDYLADLIKEYHNNNDDVIFTYDTHQKNYLTTQEGKNLPVAHCLENTEGWQLYGKIHDLAKNDKKIIKETFGSLALGNYLKNKHISHHHLALDRTQLVQRNTYLHLLNKILQSKTDHQIKHLIPNQHPTYRYPP